MIERAGGRLTFEETRVVLYGGSTQRATIELIGSKTWTYSGTWREVRRDEIRIEINNAYGDPDAFGRLNIRLDGRQVRSIDGSGRAARSDFNVSFDDRSSSGNSGVALTDLADGSGRLSIGGSRWNIDRLRVTLNRDGTFSTSFTTDRSQAITGRWDSRGRGEYSLTVTGGSGNSYQSGRGTLVTSNDRVRSLSINGRTSRSTFELDFRQGSSSGGNDDNDDDSNGQNQGFGIDATRSGRGSYVLGSDGSDARSARVHLRSNGRFEIEVRGNRTNFFRGTWVSRGDRADLNITEAFGKAARGSGSVILIDGRRSWRTFSLDGRVDSRNFRSSFVAGDSGSGGVRPPTDSVNDLLTMRSERTGDGEFVLSSNRNDFKSLRVELKPNGEFAVSVLGEPTYLFGGRYRVNGNRLSLTVESGFGGKVTGTGTIVLANGQQTFESVTIEGRWSNRPFAVRFRLKY